MADPRSAYHEKLLKATGNFERGIYTHRDFEVEDGIRLNFTAKYTSKSNIGVVIIPAFAKPREAYYALMAQLPYNVLVFDSRGHSYSEGKFDGHQLLDDINTVGESFLESKSRINFLVGIGHSIGASSLLMSSTEKDNPYDYRIALAPPSDSTKTKDKVPEKLSMTELYLYNLRKKVPADGIDRMMVAEYTRKWPGKFRPDPRFKAISVKDPEEFIESIRNTPKLTDKIVGADPESHIIYAGEDDTYWITDSKLPDTIKYVSDVAESMGMKITMMPGYNHRFNKTPEPEFIQADNSELSLLLNTIIAREQRG